jgi:O-acetylserine/cysteine efflux transporter
MPVRHVFLALIVIVLWGANFIAIHFSLEQFPPLFLVAMRFLLVAVPVLLFIPRPKVKWRWLLGYGLGFGTLQFFGLYLGMAAGFPAGLASLVLQSSAPFTVLLVAGQSCLPAGPTCSASVPGAVDVGDPAPADARTVADH